jgi:hypothetical protein
MFLEETTELTFVSLSPHLLWCFFHKGAANAALELFYREILCRVGSSQRTAAQNMCLVAVMSSPSNTTLSLLPKIGPAMCFVLRKTALIKGNLSVFKGDQVIILPNLKISEHD